MKNLIKKFQENCRKSFDDLCLYIDNKYCWKCPQRSTRDKIGCREADVWLRLKEALDDELKSHIKSASGEGFLDIVITRMLEKSRKGRTLILRIGDSDYIILKEKTSGFMRGDHILVNGSILNVRSVEGPYLVTDAGRYPVHRVEGVVLDRIDSMHPLYDYIKELGVF